MDSLWQGLFESNGVDGVWIVVAFLVSNVLTFLSTRGKSKDASKSDLLTKTIQRQDTLDKRQQDMMDDLQEEIKRVKDEMNTMRTEATQQQKRNNQLSEKYTNLIKENHALQSLIVQLQKEKDELTRIVSELNEKNDNFVEQIRLLTEEIRRKKGE